MKLREVMNSNPWMGWAVAGVVLLFALWLAIFRMGAGDDPYDPQRMQEIVTIKYTDTGKVVEMPRGRLIKMLLDQGAELDVTKGIINPETKQPTGFLYNRDDWERLVQQLNADRAAGTGGAPPAGGK